MATKLVLSALSDGEIEALRGQVPAADLLVGVSARLSAGEIGILQAAAPEAQIAAAHDQEQAKAAAADADAVFGWLTPEIFRRATRLRWVQAATAGVEMLLFPELLRSGVVLTSTRGLAAAQLADHTLALILALARHIPGVLRVPARELWARNGAFTSVELAGQTLLIVGLGSTGREVARRAAAFGMRVVATGHHRSASIPGVDEAHPPSDLPRLLPRADVVSICCPLTPETRHLFGQASLRLMKPTAYLTNVSRGGVVDHQALAEALAAGKLAGAGLDVTDPEPLPEGHPLWRMENVVITPHCGGRSDAIRRRMIELVAGNLRRFVAGEPLRHVVDKRAGN